MSAYNNDAFVVQPPPEHHIHRDSEALPGARGAGPAPDYSADVTNDPRTWADKNQRQLLAGTGDAAVVAGGQHDVPGESGNNAYSQERPMNVQPTAQGGVAIDGQEGLPEGKAKLTDKLIGKAQKVTGKATHNPRMHEEGELREAGGKAAVKGKARARHD